MGDDAPESDGDSSESSESLSERRVTGNDSIEKSATNEDDGKVIEDPDVHIPSAAESGGDGSDGGDSSSSDE